MQVQSVATGDGISFVFESVFVARTDHGLFELGVVGNIAQLFDWHARDDQTVLWEIDILLI